MKRLVLVAILASVVLFLWVGAHRVGAQSWASYSDSKYTVSSDTFTEPRCTVYMYGEGFVKNEDYKIIYWDGGGYKRVAEVQKALTPNGQLSSAHVFGPPDVEGDWHCTVYSPGTYDPESYDAVDTNIVTDDTSSTGGSAFYVDATAVPEFSAVIAAIGVAGVCFGIYYWMRKRNLRLKYYRSGLKFG